LFEELSTFDSDSMVFATSSCMFKTTEGTTKCPANTSSATIKLTINVNDNVLLASALGDMPFDHYLFGTHKNNLYAHNRKNSDSDWFSAWKANPNFSGLAAAQSSGPGKHLEIHLKEFRYGTNVFENKLSESDFDGAVTINAYDHSEGNPFISTSGNLPWVLDLPEGWRHPKERKAITLAYPNFSNWANDNNVNTDWYNIVNENNLYTE
jgi:LruC domain-containing protein